MNWARRLSLDLLGVYLLTLIYIVARAVLPGPLPRELVFLLPVSTFAFFGFSLTHAITVWGWRRAMLFLGITVFVSLAFETVGVLTGGIYGPYTYTGRLGPQLFGLVPVFIPMAWFMMGYCAYSIVDRLAEMWRLSNAWWTDIWVALTAAVALTAWDLTMDPLMVAGGHWRWLQEGAYFGIPAQNYAGWMVTAFTFYLIYRRLARRVPVMRSDDAPSWWVSLPGWVYTAAGVSNLVSAAARGLIGPAVAGFFGMAPFVLLHVVLAGASRVQDRPA